MSAPNIKKLVLTDLIEIRSPEAGEEAVVENYMSMEGDVLVEVEKTADPVERIFAIIQNQGGSEPEWPDCIDAGQVPDGFTELNPPTEEGSNIWQAIVHVVNLDENNPNPRTVYGGSYSYDSTARCYVLGDKDSLDFQAVIQ